MSATVAKAVAANFFNAVEAGDIDAATAFLAPDVQVWHNTDNKIVSRRATSQTLRFMHKALRDIEYRHRRLHAWPGGFVEQHVLTGVRRSDGVLVRLPACIVCAVNGHGSITRLDEYFDGEAQMDFGKVYQSGSSSRGNNNNKSSVSKL